MSPKDLKRCRPRTRVLANCGSILRVSPAPRLLSNESIGKRNSARPLCVFAPKFTAETPSTRRLRREKTFFRQTPNMLLKNSLSVRKREIWSAATCRSFYSGVTRDRKCRGFSNRAIGKRRQVAALQKGCSLELVFQQPP